MHRCHLSAFPPSGACRETRLGPPTFTSGLFVRTVFFYLAVKSTEGLLMQHQRTIRLQCPACGGTDFENGATEDPTSGLECTTCHRGTTREQLIEDNAEHIEIHKKELANEVAENLKKDFENTLKDAFRGNKYIKIK